MPPKGSESRRVNGGCVFSIVLTADHQNFVIAHSERFSNCRAHPTDC